ncbi:protein phosphatase Mn(2+)-dependent 1K isoform X2 [Anomalospiza imberbis]|uniref:protein phosphatase Mn(2+)-dependent 1K isoform X2 n=1 Tax=Anomalospiza imberbis TaxID=187417 RepID=UPI00358FCE2F
MSTATLINLVRNGGFQVRRRAALTSRFLQDEKRPAATCSISTCERRASRFDPDGSGRLTTWDTFGIWDNRIDEPILLPPSIKYGKPIPKVSLCNVGCASHIGKRKENEDRFDYAQLTEDILYFAVYDGHGGAAAADFCDKYMKKYIKEFLAEEENLENVLSKAFLEIDKAYERHANLSADGTAAVSGMQFTSAIASCIGLLGPDPVTPLIVTYTCHFTQKHKKLAVGRSGIICALPKSCVFINNLELYLSSEAWCLIPLQKCIFVHFHAFKYRPVTFKSLLKLGIEHKGSSHPTNDIIHGPQRWAEFSAIFTSHKN